MRVGDVAGAPGSESASRTHRRMHVLRTSSTTAISANRRVPERRPGAAVLVQPRRRLPRRLLLPAAPGRLLQGRAPEERFAHRSSRLSARLPLRATLHAFFDRASSHCQNVAKRGRRASICTPRSISPSPEISRAVALSLAALACPGNQMPLSATYCNQTQACPNGYGCNRGSCCPNMQQQPQQQMQTIFKQTYRLPLVYNPAQYR